MDKLSLKVLRYLSKQSAPVHRDRLMELFGRPAAESIRFLEKSEYIKSGSSFMPGYRGEDGRVNYISDHRYVIASLGLDFLQSKPGKDFDRWLGRISIVASVLGGALLSKPLWMLIDLICSWIWG